MRTHLSTVVLFAFSAACSSSSSPSPSSGGTTLGFTADELCALVTQDQVSAAVGTAVGPGVANGVNAPSCDWQSPDSRVAATVAASDPGAVGKIPFGLQGTPGAHVTAVSNVGDAAFFASAPDGPNAELDIKKGTRAITVTMGNTRDPGNFTQAQQESAELSIGTAAAKKM